MVVELRLVKRGARYRLQLGATCAWASLEELISTLPTENCQAGCRWCQAGCIRLQAGRVRCEASGHLPAAEVGLAYSRLALRKASREPGKLLIEWRCLVVV